MAFFISLITAVAAGVLSAWLIVRRETGPLRQLLIDQDVKARGALAEAVQAAQAAAARAEDAARRAEPPISAPAPALASAPLQPVIPAPVPTPAPPVPVAATAEEITPEILMIIAAAVAAFSGAKAKIRRVRFAGMSHGGSAWAQQGRAFVQASHNLPVHR